MRRYFPWKSPGLLFVQGGPLQPPRRVFFNTLLGLAGRQEMPCPNGNVVHLKTPAKNQRKSFPQ